MEEHKLRNLIRLVLESEVAELVDEVKLERISKDEINTIINACDSTVQMPNFDKVCSESPMQRIQNLTNWDNSVKLTVNGEIVGFYLFSDQTPYEFMNQLEQYGLNFDIKSEDLYNDLKSKKGIEGIAVGVYEDFRGKGYGRKLLEHPKSMGVDYIWGIQTRGISDIDKWLKRRELLSQASTPDGQEFWLTVQRF